MGPHIAESEKRFVAEYGRVKCGGCSHWFLSPDAGHNGGKSEAYPEVRAQVSRRGTRGLSEAPDVAGTSKSHGTRQQRG